MIITNKRFVTCLLSLTLFACQSTTPPDWYTEIPTNDPTYITSVGQGRSLNQAKESALSQINAQLWTQIDSSFSSRDTFRSHNDDTAASSVINNKINSKTTSVTFTDIDYTKIENNDIAYYVQARVKRSAVIKQLQSDIKQADNQALRQLKKQQHQDSLIWWLENRELTSLVDQIAVRQAMLKALNIDDIPLAQNVNTLSATISQVQAKLLVRFISNKSDKKAAELLADKFSNQRINTTLKNTSRVTHILRLNGELRQNKVGAAYIATQLTTLQLQGRAGTTLASNEIISSGNSLTNYAYAKEGAQRHFAEIVANQGLWESLGIK